MFKDRSPPHATIFWSGIIILAGLLLIATQLGLEALYIHQKELRQFGGSYVGLLVLLIGVGLMAISVIRVPKP